MSVYSGLQLIRRAALILGILQSIKFLAIGLPPELHYFILDVIRALFCLYINDMYNLNRDKQTKCSLYADDTAVSNNNVSLLKVQENLQRDFDLIFQWLENNDMYLQLRQG